MSKTASRSKLWKAVTLNRCGCRRLRFAWFSFYYRTIDITSFNKIGDGHCHWWLRSISFDPVDIFTVQKSGKGTAHTLGVCQILETLLQTLGTLYQTLGVPPHRLLVAWPLITTIVLRVFFQNYLSQEGEAGAGDPFLYMFSYFN